MSSTYLEINANQSAYVSEDAPNTNYHGTDLDYIAVAPNNTHKKIMFCRFPGMLLSTGKIIGSSASQKNGSVNIFLPYYWYNVIGSNAYLAIGCVNEPWDYQTVTYNNRPSFTLLKNANGASNFGVIAVTHEQYEKIRQYGVAVYLIPNSIINEINSYGMNSAFASSKPYLHVCLFDSIPIVTPIAPLRKFVDALADTTFQWNYSNEYADVQKSYVIQTSADGVSWTELSAATTSETSVVIPAGTLTSTMKYWRIKVVSLYDYESEWSAAVQIVVTAPSVCILGSVSSIPRPVVTWSCEGQQAFQARFGSLETGTIFSTAKTYKCPIFLADGTHTVSVRTQGTNGLWSQWASQTITVANVPGDAVTLVVFPKHHARLSWSGGEASDFYVLRDGVPIAKTDANEYTDFLSLGKHSYQVLEQLADGNYTLSNKVTVTLTVPNTMITPVSEESWQDLQYSLESSPTFGEAHAKTVALIHYVGRELPVAESSGFKDKTMSFTVAFKTQKDAVAFEQLIGETVCYKTKIGRMIIGVLSAFSVETNRWYSQHSCTISATDYQEEVAYE
jgi:hypothetical protein